MMPYYTPVVLPTQSTMYATSPITLCIPGPPGFPPPRYPYPQPPMMPYYTPGVLPTLSPIYSTPPIIPYTRGFPQPPRYPYPQPPMMPYYTPGVLPTQSPMYGTPTSNFRVNFTGEDDIKALSSMQMGTVCETLSRLDGISSDQITDYNHKILDNNITGMVLYNCDIDELKPVMSMKFGDWQLFRAMILYLRQCENTQTPATGKGDFLQQRERKKSITIIDPKYQNIESNNSVLRKEIDETAENTTEEILSKIKDDGNSSGKWGNDNPRKLLERRDTITEQMKIENEILFEVVDEFMSESEDDAETEAEFYVEDESPKKMTRFNLHESTSSYGESKSPSSVRSQSVDTASTASFPTVSARSAESLDAIPVTKTGYIKPILTTSKPPGIHTIIADKQLQSPTTSSFIHVNTDKIRARKPDKFHESDITAKSAHPIHALASLMPKFRPPNLKESQGFFIKPEYPDNKRDYPDNNQQGHDSDPDPQSPDSAYFYPESDQKSPDLYISQNSDLSQNPGKIYPDSLQVSSYPSYLEHGTSWTDDAKADATPLLSDSHVVIHEPYSVRVDASTDSGMETTAL